MRKEAILIPLLTESVRVFMWYPVLRTCSSAYLFGPRVRFDQKFSDPTDRTYRTVELLLWVDSDA